MDPVPTSDGRELRKRIEIHMSPENAEIVREVGPVRLKELITDKLNDLLSEAGLPEIPVDSLRVKIEPSDDETRS